MDKDLMDKMRNPPAYVEIPANVRYDNKLSVRAKLLYGDILALRNKRGFCCEDNRHFMNLLHLSDSTVRRLLNALADRGYIRVEIVRDERTREVLERKIYPLVVREWHHG